MDESLVKEIIEQAAYEVVKEQHDHLKRGRVERTFATDFRDKLIPYFQHGSIKVDSPYNKHFNAAKRLDGSVIELDIAIHERGMDENNLVAIEIETNNNPQRDDIWKLKGLTQGLDGYGYRLGFYLAVGIKKKAGEIFSMEWYKNGERV